MTKFSLSALAAALLLASVAGVAPAHAQDGLVMRQIFGNLGILPQDKDPIEYRERPGLVVPKDVNKLRPPEQAEAHTKTGAWPVDPDVVEREKEKARRNAPVRILPIGQDPIEGARLGVREMAAGRSKRGEVLGESRVETNDKAGVRLSIWEMKAADKAGATPSYPPGTEPPRRYLTEPPTGLRIPASTAPIGKRTQDGPTVESEKINDAWKRLD